MAFTQLHLHSEYSLLDGAIRINDLAERLKELGMNACAITDHGVLYGIPQFVQTMEKNDIKPILGCEFYIAEDMHKKTGVLGGENGRGICHLTLLAETDEGWHNIIKMNSLAFLEGFYYKPRIDKELLRKYSKGIICLSGCLAGELAVSYMNGGYKAMQKVAEEYRDIFGDDNYFLEIQANGLPEQAEYNAACLKLAAETGLKPVATNDCHYLRKEDERAHEVLLCLQTGKRITDSDRMTMTGAELYLKSEEEMLETFKNVPEAIENTQLIADRCVAKQEFGHIYLPKYDTPDGMSSEEFLLKLAEEGLEERLKAGNLEAKRKIYEERLAKELDIINSMGFTDYFLIVYDFVGFAHKAQIAVGPGRGSGGASLVAYCLRITDIDPIKYDLIFERFLNPDRVSMPDFDLDFCYERRGEVIDYVIEKYGEERVAQVITFGTLAPKAAIRDVVRVLDMPYAYGDKLSKMVPSKPGITLAEALEQNPDLRKERESSDDAEQVLRLVETLEGLPRHASTHAAGVIISACPISDIAPLAKNDNATVVQYTKDYIEDVGLLKFDFLGLRTLTVIRKTLELIEAEGKTPPPEEPEFDDRAVYQDLSDGKTACVFQLESPGITSFVKELQPTEFEDIIAAISLYRPGPMEQIPRYVEARHDDSKITYEHPRLEPILKTTKGCIIYQEQVMRIVRDLGGFSAGQSDNVRRAMAKKQPAVLAKYRKLFVEGGKDETGNIVSGAVANGVDRDTANHIFDELMAFAGYAFNKAHAAGYAVLAYKTAKLKHYFPLEFMAANFNTFMGNLDKAAGYTEVCRSLGIKILPPDINKSGANFTVEGDSLRFALAAIKGAGSAAIDELIKEREAEGPFKSFGDFMHRCYGGKLNKRTVESLILGAAFDSFGVSRPDMLAVYEDYANKVAADRSNVSPDQMSLFDLMSMTDPEEAESMKEIKEPDYPGLKDFSEAEKLATEKEMLGLYVSGHPLDAFERYTQIDAFQKSAEILHVDKFGGEDNADEFEAQEYGGASSTRLAADSLKEAAQSDMPVFTIGIVTEIKEHMTKRNDLMAFIQVEDKLGEVELICFADNYSKIRRKIGFGKILAVRGRLSLRDEEDPKIIVSDAGVASIDDDGKVEFDKSGRDIIAAAEKASKKADSFSDNNFYAAADIDAPRENTASSSQAAKDHASAEMKIKNPDKVIVKIRADFTKVDEESLYAALKYFKGKVKTFIYDAATGEVVHDDSPIGQMGFEPIKEIVGAENFRICEI